MPRGYIWPSLTLTAIINIISAPPSYALPVLQCVPYARIVSGVELYGDAWTWWEQANERYRRGNAPKKGAIMAFRPAGPMTLGHVAVVSQVLGKRRVLIRHANWSAPGAIEEDVLAIDVSESGDWSAVRVWHSPTDQMGSRANPTYGFIYPNKAKLHKFTPDPSMGSSTRLAKTGSDRWDEVKAPMKQASVQIPMKAQKPRLTLNDAGIGAGAAPQPRKPRLKIQLARADRERSLSDIIADVKKEARLR